jgi:hypothetical protein
VCHLATKPYPDKKVSCSDISVIISIIYYINRQARILYFFFLSLCTSHEKFEHTVRKVVGTVDLQKLIIYISPQGYTPKAFKVSMLVSWKNFSGLVILAALKTNASNT